MRDALYVIADIPKAMELDSYDPDSKTWIEKAGCYIIEASLTYREMTMIESVANRALVLKEKGYCVRCNNYDIAVEW